TETPPNGGPWAAPTPTDGPAGPLSGDVVTLPRHWSGGRWLADGTGGKSYIRQPIFISPFPMGIVDAAKRDH
ncbi:MAG: hypothetical protein OXD45_14805, partial [Rhodobacteraceae bacterium]|nr:hypothetical protein [Paracoccaceae bacterium]